MTDPELDQLARALTAATDRLNSDDFRSRQARYLAMEQEFITLGNELEAEEKAVEAAQAALTAYVRRNYIDPFADVPEDDERELFGSDEMEEAMTPYSAANGGPSDMVAGLLFGSERYVRIDEDGLRDITPIPTDEDEYATAKANGALS